MLDGGSVVMETHKYRGEDKEGRLAPTPLTHPSGHNDKHTGLLTGTAPCVSQLEGKTSARLAEQIEATTHC